MLAVGLMSGTSLDGIDAVLCEIEGHGPDTEIKEIEFITETMDQDIKNKIKQCCENQATVELVCSLNFELGEVFAKAVKKVCQIAEIETTDLSFIASHGQTIYHIPIKNKEFVASTFQIGESAVIAQRCHCPVISNFRVKDIAAGGQGAPLVPFSEYVLYRSKEHAVALQNIGGIGNVTILPKNCEIDDVYAFDTGPGNMMIDEAMHHFYSCAYDKNGEIAAKGIIIKEMAEELKEHKYIQMSPPKTTGREVFGKAYVDKLIGKYKEKHPEDIVATLTWFTAYSIATNIKKFVLSKDMIQSLVLGGGGAHNKTLQHMLKEMLPEVKVLTQENLGFSSDAKEALAFVILGNETLHKSFSNVPKATGANKKVILGTITYPD